jgi:hypothetical protein
VLQIVIQFESSWLFEYYVGRDSNRCEIACGIPNQEIYSPIILINTLFGRRPSNSP